MRNHIAALDKREAKVQAVRPVPAALPCPQTRVLAKPRTTGALNCCPQDMDTQVALARKKTKAGDKRGAIMHLKKKKLYEKERDQLGNTKLMLDQQVRSCISPPAAMRACRRREPRHRLTLQGARVSR
jgi:hypothetical protein